jgi:agmatine deiminase
MASLPAALGFRMPAEWEPHEATWIAWPHNSRDWPGKFANIAWVYVDIVRHLHKCETVRILVNDAAAEKQARRQLKRAGIDMAAVEFFLCPTNRVWTRDYGPLFAKGPDGSVALTNWHFNAWAKYADWQKDDAIPSAIARSLGMKMWEPVADGQRVVLEGGSIDVNGEGLLLTTEECLLGKIQARNPSLGREGIEKVLSDYLGVRKVLWLGHGIAGDDTHGHVDDVARFVGPGTVVCTVEENEEDENNQPLADNLARLKEMTDEKGKPLQIVSLPMPEPLYFAGQRLPASYVNFYVANDLVLVPTFNDAHDRKALGILADLFPGRKIVGIHAVDLVWGLGTLHCLTQQQPART